MDLAKIERMMNAVLALDPRKDKFRRTLLLTIDRIIMGSHGVMRPKEIAIFSAQVEKKGRVETAKVSISSSKTDQEAFGRTISFAAAPELGRMCPVATAKRIAAATCKINTDKLRDHYKHLMELSGILAEAKALEGSVMYPF